MQRRIARLTPTNAASRRTQATSSTGREKLVRQQRGELDLAATTLATKVGLPFYPLVYGSLVQIVIPLLLCWTTSGYYMYIEATGRRSGDNAKMYRTVLLTGNSCLSLYVHMLGTNEDMGAFKIWLDGHPLFSLHQNYGERWQHFEGIPLLGNGKKLVRL